MRIVTVLFLLFVGIHGHALYPQINQSGTDQGVTLSNSVQNFRPRQLSVPNVAHLRLVTVDKTELKESVELERKKYLTFSFELALIDDYETKSRIRYNIYEDEIEFIKENSIYYLVREVGRRIYFLDSKFIYKVYRLDGANRYFRVHEEGKYSLLAKQKVRRIEPKVARSGYDRAKPGNYRRIKDEYYLALDNNSVQKLPKNKKEFIEVFGDKSEIIQSFMKQNKLNHRRLDDLKKIIQYYNIL